MAGWLSASGVDTSRLSRLITASAFQAAITGVWTSFVAAVFAENHHRGVHRQTGIRDIVCLDTFMARLTTGAVCHLLLHLSVVRIDHLADIC